MQRDFWEQRWQQDQTGFHLNQVNPYLQAHWRTLSESQTAQVFVPLCGKSLDLIWLQQQGHTVVGVECSEKAVKAFFSEQALKHEISSEAPFQLFHAEGLSIYQGDYFQLDQQALRHVSLVYDRAALVALPQEMRKVYAEKMLQLLPGRVSMLLVALEYEQALMPGPPFSVGEKEIDDLYGHDFNIARLHRQDILQQQGCFRERGLDSMVESVYKLTRL